jgi:hypothetical protein
VSSPRSQRQALIDILLVLTAIVMAALPLASV